MRISCHIYNELEEYRTLGRVILDMVKENIKSNNHVKVIPPHNVCDLSVKMNPSSSLVEESNGSIKRKHSEVNI